MSTVDKLRFALSERATPRFAPNGSIAIRPSLGPRLVGATVGAVCAGVLGVAFAPIALGVLAAVAGTAGGYWWSGRALAVFDADQRLLIHRAGCVPFEALNEFHTIERREERARTSLYAELLAGPELVIRHEVYTRYQGAPLVVADFLTKEEALELATRINRTIGAGAHAA